jgi:hypothetical protein
MPATRSATAGQRFRLPRVAAAAIRPNSTRPNLLCNPAWDPRAAHFGASIARMASTGPSPKQAPWQAPTSWMDPAVHPIRNAVDQAQRRRRPFAPAGPSGAADWNSSRAEFQHPAIRQIWPLTGLPTPDSGRSLRQASQWRPLNRSSRPGIRPSHCLQLIGALQCGEAEILLQSRMTRIIAATSGGGPAGHCGCRNISTDKTRLSPLRIISSGTNVGPASTDTFAFVGRSTDRTASGSII